MIWEKCSKKSEIQRSQNGSNFILFYSVEVESSKINYNILYDFVW